MHLKNKKVLVTGAGGFIGSHLTEYLVREGAEVRAVVHYNSRNDWGNLNFLPKDLLPEVDVHSIDITDPFSVRQVVEDCECVFHLAALIGIPYSYLAPAAYFEVNVRGTLNVLEAVRAFQIPRMVHTSTSETYGTARYTPMDEKHPLQGQSPYSASKIAADKLVESYWCSFGLPVSTLRPFNTFGPRQSARAVIPTIISQLKRDGKVRLGSLSPIRDFTYVTDTARAFVAVSESDSTLGIACNAGNGQGITIGDLANMLIGMVKPDAEIICEEERKRPEKSEVKALIASTDLIRTLTSWKPQVSLKNGLSEVIDFVERHPKIFSVDQYVV
ncbi:SDR family NAD(P)-dependent oxidoreductase [Leptolyngbya sp. KIOST-1]|uniref:SDR family NAD(P)-dependent oxidoreductase n=1 Tax=Leptolyngbya sp. KIOST-1 TaxID=1229172 RepID=UPI0009079AD3|nr:SDR family NAD(P)-dependent oxidoreductase [Leptolyngbya sp. KIOST-1]